ncbi:hypothetical protein ACFQ0M_44260 [Kitasatospora aburaviensis]
MTVAYMAPEQLAGTNRAEGPGGPWATCCTSCSPAAPATWTRTGCC